MSLFSIVLAAGGIISGGLAAPIHYNAPYELATSLSKRADAYKLYTGKADNPVWPKSDQWWASYDAMFRGNLRLIREGCGQYNVPLMSNQEITDLDRSIKQVSVESNVDTRFILAVILEESSACVRAPTSNYGVRNPGLMQSHNGVGTCNEGGVQTPCPSEKILLMVQDGVKGTAHGDGLVQLIQKGSGNQDTRYYQAARMYNSGSLHVSGDLEKGIASHCYVSDIANRLSGWTLSQKGCDLDGTPAPALGGFSDEKFVSSLDIGTTRLAESNTTPIVQEEPIQVLATPPAPELQIIPIPSPEVAPVQSTPEVAVETTPNSQPASSAQPVEATASNLAPGVSTKCAKYYRVETGDFCLKVAEKFGTTFGKLRELNTALDENCSNLWLGYDYCIESM